MSSSAHAPNAYGLLGPLETPLALGLLRLSTEGRPSEADAVAVIHAALDRGIRILDTADSYALADADMHYGAKLARAALDSWKGPRDEVKVVTKVGFVRSSWPCRLMSIARKRVVEVHCCSRCGSS